MDEKLCECCGIRPVAGYHNRLRCVLEKLCYQCYKNHPDDDKQPIRNSSVVGGKAGARS